MQLKIKKFNLSARHMLAKCIKGKWTYVECCSTASPIPGTEGLTIEDMLEEKVGMTEDEVVEHVSLNQSLSKMSERDKTVILMKMNGYTQHEIGQVLGCSQSKVSRILISIKRKYFRKEKVQKS